MSVHVRLLGDAYSKGLVLAINMNEAVKYVACAAEGGHAVAQNFLGSISHSTVHRNLLNADISCFYFYWVGECYANGIGVDQNFAMAVRYFTIAAEQGNGYALCNLGKVFTPALALISNRLVHILGICYEAGFGVEKNLTEALRLYQRSAEKECPAGYFYLGWYKAFKYSLLLSRHQSKILNCDSQLQEVALQAALGWKQIKKKRSNVIDLQRHLIMRFEKIILVC